MFLFPGQSISPSSPFQTVDTSVVVVRPASGGIRSSAESTSVVRVTGMHTLAGNPALRFGLPSSFVLVSLQFLFLYFFLFFTRLASPAVPHGEAP